MPSWRKAHKSRSNGVIKNYLMPTFGSKLCLRDLYVDVPAAYFTSMVASPLSHESKDKIRDVLSSILGSASSSGCS